MVAALGEQTINHDEVKSIFGYSFEFPNLGLQIEADQFIDRVRNAATIADPFEADAADPRPDHPSTDGVQLELTTGFRVARVRPLTCFSVNVLVRNVGEHSIDPDKFPQIRIAAMWTDLKSKQSIDADRTHLLVPIRPGGSLTMPLFATSPEKPGRYRIEFSGIIEGERWLTNGRLRMEIEVSPDAPSLEETDWRRTGMLRDYMGDHKEALNVLSSWLDQYTPSRKSIVELGGNSNPMARGMAATVFNVDIDPYGLIVGKIRDAKTSKPTTNLVSDGMNLPFANNSIDAFAMFATYHHFPDPVGLLRHLSTKLTDEGVIALMCEPIGHVAKHTVPEEYRRELLKGVNEQSFAFWEYAQMFDDAGLHVVESQIDVGSLKVLLKKKRDERPRSGWAKLKSFLNR